MVSREGRNGMKINRLRLLGFKSFVEPTELVIEKGLTGVVGPNGCGKSNLLEALRWVMGETSHKSVRAAAMDDVIFAGTTGRPGRNTAEVTIFLDNRARAAPAEFNDHDLIEITRRIEREAGSAYRINGREVRARDVKILFEDAATGARSPSLVRQGQIGEIVNSKPEQRRRILEDAAGIAGLHSRRHEAELRLKAAEGNLARLGDILGQLSTQIESLKRQARAARRYKEISAEIRKVEAILMYLAWTEAQSHVDAEEAGLGSALGRLAEATEVEAKALRNEAELAQCLPPLREAEAARGAALARLHVEQSNFEREAERTANRQRELASRAAQLTQDLEREGALVAEAREIVARLEAELAKEREAEAGAVDAEQRTQALLAQAKGEEREADARLAEITARDFELKSRRTSLETSLAERKDQASKIERQLAALECQVREIVSRAPDATRLAELQQAGQRSTEELKQLEDLTADAESRLQIASAQAAARREALQQASLDTRALETELATLTTLLQTSGSEDFPPILDSLTVAPGYEAALGAALGDDLDAPIAAESPVHWRHVDPAHDDAGLPEGAEPLLGKVNGPKELTRRLRQVGVIDAAAGPRLQPALKSGQRLVTRQGDLWRWDGFVAAAEAPTPATQRLAARNRLKELLARQAQSRKAAETVVNADVAAQDALRQAEANERGLRLRAKEVQTALAGTRDALSVIERAARETESRLAAVREAQERANDSLAEAVARVRETEIALGEVEAVTGLEGDLAAAQARAQGARARLVEAGAHAAGLARERALRIERLGITQSEHQRWQARSAGAGQQIATLKSRLGETRSELDGLAELPARIEAQRQKLFNELSRAEQERKQAADQLAAADTELREASQALRAAQSEVATEREGRARMEARLEAARTRRSDEARKIRDTLGIAPDGCLELAGVAPGARLPSLPEAESQLSRFKADRERLGGVNLQADDELQTLSAQFQAMQKERSDVEEAIVKLRTAIGQLNRESKKRLDDAFNSVDAHFRKLFTTLFGGGEAQLEMIEGEDPLEGGLEIIAKPPGKKPATLSLLSGGEQALTALSLIFAVFLTNPSPICVLDEVDAPLDDGNVDRFCRLMEKMADETDTRFLVITHHPMTMARMHRLFGVTMGEKGVSQLVSVDLATAERIIDNGPQVAARA
jgi:chromosome segregation protein